MPGRFFSVEAEHIAEACLAMARRFHRGGRLMAFGAGNAVTDAQHVSVEFVHPILVGKRALPAIALGTDIAASLGLAKRMGWSALYAQQLATLGCAEDIALGIDPTGEDEAILAGLKTAQERGMLTIGLLGGVTKTPGAFAPDFSFVVPSADTAVVQETHETLYHMFWELVHVFFEHPLLLSEPSKTSSTLNVHGTDHADSTRSLHGVRSLDDADLRLTSMSPSSARSSSVCVPDQNGYCAICADQGLPGRVLKLLPGNMALVDMRADAPADAPAGTHDEHEVALDLVHDVKVGDRLLIHLDVAIASLPDEVDTQRDPQPDLFADFLYPFLEEKHTPDSARGGSQGDDARVLLKATLDEVRGSILHKARDIATLRQTFFAEQGEMLARAATTMTRAFGSGKTLLAFGNGGSATDAQDIAADFMNPGSGSGFGPGKSYRSLPALSLTNDIGVVTAVGNDVGFDNVFVRQIIAFGRPGDIALGFSSSGQSSNLLAAFAQAKKMQLTTIGIAGYDGGQMARAGLEYCFVVHSTYVPRIQEVQATIYHTLWTLIQHILEADHEIRR